MKKAIILLCLLLPAVSFIQSQTNIDSLERVVAGKSPEIDKVKALNILSYEYLFSDPKKADSCMLKLYYIAEETRHDDVRAEALRAIADQYTDLEDYSKAGEYYRKARDLFKTINTETGEKGYARTLLHYAYIPHMHGDFNEALLLYTEAEPALLKHKQYRYLINLYNRECDIYEQLHQPENAMVYVKKAMELCEKNNDVENLVRSLYTYTANSQNTAKNLEYLQKAYDLIKKHQLPDWLLFYYHFNLGGELFKIGKFSEAYKQYIIAEELAFDTREKMGPAIARANILLAQKQYPQAGILLDTLLQQAISNHMKVQIRDVYNLQISRDSTLGNFKNAYLLMLKRNALNDSLLTEDSKKRIDYLHAKYQSAQRESQIIQLQDEKKIQLIWIIASIVGIVLLIIVIIFIYKNYKKKQLIALQQIEQLKKEKQLEATQAVLVGETTERTRISRELHDGLGGLLSGTKLILNNMKGNVVLTESHVSQFDHALSLLDNSITELRRVAYNMMPENLHLFGLKKALEEFCNGLNNSSGINLQFSFFGTDQRFEQNSEVIAFRITQEMLNNALKHASATNINIQLVQEESRVSLTVQDNGKGFDPQQIDECKSSGLRNIRSRVDSLGGHFSVYSEAGQGTEMTVEFGIKSNP
jgi:two-component system, NarL family, sensor kinase